MAKQVTITIEDEVNCIVAGLSPDHHAHFWNVYGIKHPNHFFNPKFKLGSWDGNIRFYQKTGKTYVYLLEQIVPMIEQLGYTINLNDRRSAQYVYPEYITDKFFNHIINEETDEPYEMWEHQVRVVNKLLEHGSGIAVAATGAGKTMICAALSKQYIDQGLKVIIIVPSQDLIEQTRDDFTLWKLPNGEYSGTTKDYLNHNCVISTWQALSNVPQLMNGFDVVIVDECHGAKATELTALLHVHGKNICHRFGVTGTIPLAECEALTIHCGLGSVVETVTADELIAAGVLATLDIVIEQLDEDLTKQYEQYLEQYTSGPKATYIQFKDQYFGEYSAEKSYLQKFKPRLQWMANRIGQLRQQGNTFVLVDGVPFGKQLQTMIPNSVFVHGSDKKAVRKQIYKQFRDNDNLCVIATVNIASTGINIKRIYNLVLIDIGKSFTRVIQSIGRGLRRAPDKDHVDVLDICSDLKYGKKHATERTKYYTQANYPNRKIKIQRYEASLSEVV